MQFLVKILTKLWQNLTKICSSFFRHLGKVKATFLVKFTTLKSNLGNFMLAEIVRGNAGYIPFDLNRKFEKFAQKSDYEYI